MIKTEIPRGDKNVYEKMDSDNWMLLPKFTSEDETSYLDISDIVLSKPETLEDEDELDIEWVFAASL